MRWFLSLIAVLSLGFALYLVTSKTFQSLPTGSAQGHVISVQGQVMGRAVADKQSVRQLQAHSPLQAPMELITGLDSEASLTFGESFRVFSQSTLLLEKIGPKYRVHLLKGRLLRNKINRNVEFIVKSLPADPEVLELQVPEESGDNPQPSSTETSANSLSKEETTKNSLSRAETTSDSESEADSKDHSPNHTESNLQKSQEQSLLKETLSLHQRFLEKCFIQHFERLKGQTQAGQVLMKFVIQKDGRLRDVSIKKSPYSDKDLHQCLIAVMKRVRIKKVFEQDTPVEFPLQISLP